jgi:hypothetical protein
MKRSWRAAVIPVIVGALIAAGHTAAMALPASSISIPLAQAVQVPVPVDLTLGQPAIVRLERPVIVVTDSPPGLVHPIVRGNTVLLVPLREGSTTLVVGLGDGLSARLALSIGADAGTRLILLSGSTVTRAGPATSHASAPPSQPGRAPASTADPTDPPPNTVGSFIATLSPDQRQALVEYLRAPSLVSLSTLVRLLSPSQQHMLADVLASRDTVSAGAPQTPQPAPTVTAAPPQPAHATAPPSLAQADPGVTVSAPAGIAIHVVPTTTGGVLYLSYVLQNGTGKALRADPHEIEVTGASGPITVRQMDLGTPGEIGAGSMETGVIMLTPTSGRVSATWRLRDDAGDVVPVGIVVVAR